MGCTASIEKDPVLESAKLKTTTRRSKHTNEAGSLETKQTSSKQDPRPTSIEDQDVENGNYLAPTIETQGAGECTISAGKVLTILHFNDVYNIEPREKEPIGGAARFAHKLASYRHLNPLTVFSGDVLNPSMMSSVTKGKHMVPVLNSLNIDVAVYGNHDFDFGVDDLIEFNEATNFPWLMSNVIDKTSDGPLANGDITKMLEWNGTKASIGFIGLVEEEWLATLATIDPSEVIFQDYATRGTELAKQLRDEGATLVIAITHMRIPNDTRLAEASVGIDLILGGHDHHYEVKDVNGIKIIKSGSDFREFSKITINFSEDNNFNITDVERIEITSEVPEDPELKAVVDKYMDVMKESMEETLGHVEVELDGRFASLRTKETNLGNFVTDIMHNVSKADVVLLNSGTLRSDELHPPGVFKKKVSSQAALVAILPMPDSMVVIEISVYHILAVIILSCPGKQLLRALENGVSQWPKLEGRFPQISGMKFAFNPDLKPGNRVVKDSVVIGTDELDLNKLYKLCTKSYIAKGKDGYDVFAECKILVNIHVLKHIGDSRASILNAEKHHVKIDPKVEGRIINIKDLKYSEPQETKDACEKPEKGHANDVAEDEEEEVTQIISGQVVRSDEEAQEVCMETNTATNAKV
ncbi:hypothetical protein QZH41_019303 [Actinostola sp. cb2023]|nr:hypothetical protein QZH41_019303 [Actinostola sp. cb2023]